MLALVAGRLMKRITEVRQNKSMLRIEYIAPTLTLHYYEVEQGFGASQGSPNFNTGIGPWEEENEDYNIK